MPSGNRLNSCLFCIRTAWKLVDFKSARYIRPGLQILTSRKDACCSLWTNFMKKELYILTLAYFIMACRTNGRSTVSYTTHIKEGPKLKDWQCNNIDSDRICTPSNWKQSKQNKYLYYCRLDSSDKNVYFVILKYNTVTDNLSDTKYLSITYNALIKGTIEKFERYTSKEITFNDKKTYFSEYYTLYNNKSYLTQSTVFIAGKNLYEIAIKSVDKDTTKYQQIYPNILFNFRHQGKAIFSSKDQVKQIQSIDLSNL